MKALLLAAGEGTRLRPLTNPLPKCLVPILGVPLLEYWLRTLAEMGITDILVNTHSHADQVDRFLLRPGLRIETVFEKRLLGTAGTIRANRRFLSGDDVLVVHADNLSQFDGQAFLKAYSSRPARAEGTMMTFETDSPESCGIVALDAEGLINQFVEKSKTPPGKLANGAVYIFSRACMDSVFAGQANDLSTEVLPRLVGRMNTFRNEEYHRDVGTPGSYLTATRDCLVRGSFPASSPAWQDLAGEDLWSGWCKAWRESGQAHSLFENAEQFLSSLANGRAAPLNIIRTAGTSDLAKIRAHAMANRDLRFSIFNLVP